MSQQWVGDPGAAYTPPGAWPTGDPSGPSATGDPHPEIRGRAMTAFFLSAFFTAMCCGVMVLPSLICSGLALSRVGTRPDTARELTKWSFIALGAGVGITVIFIAFIVAITLSGAGQQA